MRCCRTQRDERAPGLFLGVWPTQSALKHPYETKPLCRLISAVTSLVDFDVLHKWTLMCEMLKNTGYYLNYDKQVHMTSTGVITTKLASIMRECTM